MFLHLQILGSDNRKDLNSIAANYTYRHTIITIHLEVRTENIFKCYSKNLEVVKEG